MPLPRPNLNNQYHTNRDNSLALLVEIGRSTANAQSTLNAYDHKLVGIEARTQTKTSQSDCIHTHDTC